MTYSLISTLNVSANNGKQLIQGLNKTSLLIEINGEQTFQNGDLLERVVKSGRVFGCRWIQGQLKGQLQPLEYGQHEILLDVPNPLLAFDLEVVPNRYQFNYQVKVYTKTFNPRFDVLAEKLGISVNTLQFFPEQTLLFLEGLNLMAGSDTRKLQADLQAIANAANAADAKAVAADAKASSAQTKATTVEGELISAKAEMVQSREFELTQASFVLGTNEFGPCYIATVTHDLMGGTVQMSLLDADGDAQGYSQLIANKPGQPDKAMVELSTAQYMENSFPLNFVLQGQVGAGVVPTSPGMNGLAVQGTNYMVRLNTAIQRLERKLNGSTSWEIVRDDQNIQAAMLAPDGRIDVRLADGVTYVWTDINGAAWQGSNQTWFDGLGDGLGRLAL